MYSRSVTRVYKKLRWCYAQKGILAANLKHRGVKVWNFITL